VYKIQIADDIKQKVAAKGLFSPHNIIVHPFDEQLL
jgi:hypothetical protein